MNRLNDLNSHVGSIPASVMVECMSSTVQTDFESESYTLVEEFLERDLLSPEAAHQAEQLAAEDAAQDALEVILADRRQR